MSVKSSFIDPAIAAYVVRTAVREDPALRELREETSRHPHGFMAIGPEQGAFMQLLARTIGARRYLEIGVFTGYSSLAMALALPRDGYVLACDVSDEYTQTARRYWKAAGIEGKIDLRLGPALETLARLRDDRLAPFDIAFIDADKTNVESYYESALELIRPGGLVLVDNALRDGRVLDPQPDDRETLAIDALNLRAGADERVDAALLTIGDGLLIARKR
jgi:predicted O-methyltransferase YrrM